MKREPTTKGGITSRTSLEGVDQETSHVVGVEKGKGTPCTTFRRQDRRTHKKTEVWDSRENISVSGMRKKNLIYSSSRRKTEGREVHMKGSVESGGVREYRSAPV